jgi:hypothetical protein
MKAVHLFLDTDMRCGHYGLFLVAKKSKVLIQTLRPGEAVIFINTAKNKIKTFGPNGVVSYLRVDKGIRPTSFDSFTDAVSPGMKMQFSPSVRAELLQALGLNQSKAA